MNLLHWLTQTVDSRSGRAKDDGVSLAQPPFLEHLLFENPWPAMAASAAIGIGMLWLGRSRAKPRQMAAGAILIALAAFLFLLANLVTTTREEAVAQTQKLVAAVTPLQMNEIRSLLDEQVALSAGDEMRGGGAVLSAVEATSNGRFGLQSHTIKQIDAEATSSDHVRVQFDVLTVAKNGRMITRWLLDWRRADADQPWKVVAIEWLPSDDTMIGMKPDLSYVPRDSVDNR